MTKSSVLTFPISKSLSILLLLCFQWLGAFAQDLETEIKNLQTSEKVSAYWESLRLADLEHRAADRIIANDNLNYKKTILLLKYYGFPYKSKVPFVIAVHQQSRNVNEYYFPVFYEAFKSGKTDTIWFFHFLRGLYRMRFDRDLVRHRAIYLSDIDTFLTLLKPFIKQTPDYSLQPFDSLHALYTNDLKKITTGKVLSRWANADNDSVVFYKVNNKTYYLHYWRDGSCTFPQEVTWNKKKSRYDFVVKSYDDYVAVLENDIAVVQENCPTEVFKKR